MQILTVEIGNKSFKVACGPGDEERLFAAAQVIDEMFRELKGYSPHASNELLFVMCALQLQDTIVNLKEAGHGGATSTSSNNSDIAEAVDALSEASSMLEGVASKIKNC